MDHNPACPLCKTSLQEVNVLLLHYADYTLTCFLLNNFHDYKFIKQIKKKIQIWDRYLFFNVSWIALQYLAERRQNVTEFLDVAMATFLPTEYAERSRIYDEDMQQLASSSNVCLYIYKKYFRRQLFYLNFLM
jgi:hypothetical protein